MSRGFFRGSRDQLESPFPEGPDLISASGSIAVTSRGTFMRRDQRRDIKGNTMEDLRARTPDGWKLAWVRAL